MLVLTRKLGQSIMIGDRVEVQVLSVAGEKVRLGITAPEDVSIFRNEAGVAGTSVQVQIVPRGTK